MLLYVLDGYLFVVSTLLFVTHTSLEHKNIQVSLEV